MNITVEYEKRSYGFGTTVRRYKLALREVNGFYSDGTGSYKTRELELGFRALPRGRGKSWDDASNAEVLGGHLKLSKDAARQLADAILKFLGNRKKDPAESSEIEVNEKPQPEPWR